MLKEDRPYRAYLNQVFDMDSPLGPAVAGLRGLLHPYTNGESELNEPVFFLCHHIQCQLHCG